MSRVASDIIYRLQKEIDEKFTRLPVRYFDEQSRGDLLSRATNDIQTIDDSFSQVSNQIFYNRFDVLGDYYYDVYNLMSAIIFFNITI